MADFDVAPTTVDPANPIPDAIQEKFAEVFSPEKTAGTSDSEVDVAAAKTTPAPSRREVARQVAAKKEQAEELDQEGLTGVDNPDGDAVEPATEVEGDEKEASLEAGQEEEEAPTEVAPLDPNLRFAAQQFGWTDAKIDRLVKADPELATETFSNLLQAFTNLSRQYVAPPVAPATQPQAAQSAESQLDKLYRELAAFGEENGNSIVERFLKPLQSEIIEPFRQMQAQLAVQQQQAINAEASTTLSTLTDKFGEVYGKDETKLTLPQQQSRQQLGTIADQIRAGAKAQGVNVSVRDAINRAHLIVTADRRTEDGRRQVQAQVQKRNKSITARPTHRAKPKTADEQRSDATALEAFSKRASELGIEVE